MAARPPSRAVLCAVVAGSRTGTNCSRTVDCAKLLSGKLPDPQVRFCEKAVT